MRIVFGAIAVAIALCGGVATAQVAAPGDMAAPDPSLVAGVLPNGLRYYVLPNHTPRQQVSIRLHVAAGSLVETEAERGAAHFVEHMAFQGSRRFPGTSADTRFADAGIGAGRDQNAFTDVNGALYVFDIPQVTAAKLDLAFDWMRDTVDALTFDPAAVDRERQVVLQELAVRRTGSTELGEAVARFYAPGLLAAKRSPGGTAASLGKLDAAALRAFHDRWYRPERSILVVVGDVDPAAMVARITAAFTDWSPAAPAPSEPDQGTVDTARPLATVAVTTPNFSQGTVQVCRIAPRDPALPAGVAAWRRDGADAIWLQALRLRLRKLARAPEGALISATTSRTDTYRRASFTCVVAAPKAGRWKDALALVSTEVRRMLEHGVTASEAERARAEFAVAVETAASAADTRASRSIATQLLALALDHKPLTTPAESARTFRLAEPSLTAAAASDAFRARWRDGGGPAIVVLSTTTVSSPEVRAAWVAAQAAPSPGPVQDEAQTPWPYTDFGAPGAVVARTEMKDPDFTRLLFRNGVRMNFKRTSYLKARVDIRVAFGAGQQELKPAQQIAAVAGVNTLGEGGLGKLEPDALGVALQGRIWGASLAVGRSGFTLSGGTRAQDLTTEMQLLAAFLTDPGFRPEVERRIPTLAESYDKENRIEPMRAAQLALNASLPGPHLFDPPPRSVFAALTAADMRAALAPALTQAPLEVTIVGDVDEAAAVDAVARTLGALPPRAPGSRVRTDAERTRYPDQAPDKIRVTHDGLRDKAAVWMVWPLYVWSETRQRETRVLTLLREVMAAALRKEVRERLGLTYTPSVGLASDRGGDQGALSVAVYTSPAQVDRVVEVVRGVADRLAKDGVTPEALERVRRPLMEETARRTESNAWWLTVLDGSWAFPYKLEQQRTWLRDYTTISAAEVSAAAKRWLSRAPLAAVATPAPSRDATSAPAATAPQTATTTPPPPLPIPGAPT